MEVSFATSRLKAICESGEEMLRAHGERCANTIMARLADLAAAPTLEEFRYLPGRCRELPDAPRQRFALRLADGKHLIFEPYQPRSQTDGKVANWSLVDAVRVLDIVAGGER